MALVEPYINTRSRNRNQGKMLTRSCNNSPVTNKFKNSINLNITIPASNFQNGMNIRKRTLVPLTGVMSEKNMCNIISSIKQSDQVIPKKEPKKRLKVGKAFRKSMRLLIRNQGTMNNISGISTRSEIPQPVTMPRTVEFFTDVRNSQSLYKSLSEQPDELKFLYLAGLGLYRTQVGDMDHQRQILEKECNKFHTIRLNSSFQNNAISSVEDNTNTIISPPIVKPRFEFEAPEKGIYKIKGRNESVEYHVNMTVVFTPVGDQHMKNEIDIKSEESDVSFSLQSDEDEFIAFTQDTVKTNVNNTSEAIEGWQSFDTYMKDQLEQEQIECTPKTNCKQEIADAKRKLVELTRQWSSWKLP